MLSHRASCLQKTGTFLLGRTESAQDSTLRMTNSFSNMMSYVFKIMRFVFKMMKNQAWLEHASKRVDLQPR